MQGSAEPRTRFAMFGDSTALSLWAGLGPWLKRDGGAATMRGYIKMGCGLFAYGERENRGKWSPEGRGCAAVPDEWRARVVASPPDAAIVLVGPWETRNRRAHADAPELALGDPELDAATLAAMIDAIDRLSATDARVIWLTSPRIRMPPLAGKLYDSDTAASDPRRIDRLNELVREAALARPDRARVVDLAAYMRDRAGGEFDRSIREDDVHFTQKGATALAREWLGAAVLRAYAEMRPGSARGGETPTNAAPTPAGPG